ncbi:hypothetical protein IAF33_19090, partial [Acinetobacter baumannii]|uniref:hypothetical protein n=1 Tax=Acinetobacter baumannii TaxID=470 RepID=UPI00165F77E9
DKNALYSPSVSPPICAVGVLPSKVKFSNERSPVPFTASHCPVTLNGSVDVYNPAVITGYDIVAAHGNLISDPNTNGDVDIATP